MGELDLREELKRGVKLHPRVMTQNLFMNDADRARLAAAVPVFLPFRGKSFKAVLWIIDWDHRLPSRDCIIRLYAYYSSQGRALGQRAF